MSDARKKGQAIFAEIYGPQMAAGMTAHIESGAFGADVARYSNDFAFGEIWARKRLERKLRSCSVLGMMIALRQTDEIGYHTHMGMANGLTRAEIEEAAHHHMHAMALEDGDGEHHAIEAEPEEEHHLAK